MSNLDHPQATSMELVTNQLLLALEAHQACREELEPERPILHRHKDLELQVTVQPNKEQLEVVPKAANKDKAVSQVALKEQLAMVQPSPSDLETLEKAKHTNIK